MPIYRISPLLYHAGMTNDDSTIRKAMASRLVEAREAAGWKSRKAACERFGFNVNTCKSHEYAIRGFSQADAERYATSYRVPVSYLMGEDLRTTHELRTTPPFVTHETSEGISAPLLRLGELDHASVERVPFSIDGTDTSPQDTPYVPHAVPSQSTDPTCPNQIQPLANRPSRPDAPQVEIPVLGILAHGLWLAEGGPQLHDDTCPVPAAPGIDRQFARQVVGGTAARDLVPGDYVIFSQHPSGRLPKGRVSVRRTKGRLVETALWNSDGRRLVSDSATLADQEIAEYDPDDDSLTIEGVAVALYRRL